MGSRLFNRLAVFAAASVVAATTALAVGGAAAAATTVYCPSGDLQSAMNQAQSGSTVAIVGTCVGNFVAPTNKTITLQGGVLDGNNSGAVLSVPDTANITL